MPRPVSLSLELLQTFLLIVENHGDAAETARQLNINQPSMSKRLRYLQLTSPVLKHPWLVRIGKKWRLTEEGEKVLPAVRELISRYEQLTTFQGEREAVQPDVSFACGRQSAEGFVQVAVKNFFKELPSVRLRLSTLRGEARIEGVANGSLDLATVTHDAESIRAIARRDLHIESIAKDRFALVCAENGPWAPTISKLAKTKASPAAVSGLPLILPEPDAGIRKTLDEVFRQEGLARTLDIRLEVGGWNTILDYVREGHGVGLVSESSLTNPSRLIVRYFDPQAVPAVETRLIARRMFENSDKPDLSPSAMAFRQSLLKAVGK